MQTRWLSAELADLAEDFPRFIQELSKVTGLLKLDLTLLEIDHISVRCHHNATAERWKKGFSQIADCFSEKMINGRPVCLFRLYQPLRVAQQSVAVVELPWPGNKHYPHEGWEHIEIVLRGAPEMLNQRVMALIPESVLLQLKLTVKYSSPKGEKERLANPTLAIMSDTLSIKFHPWSIEEIVASEKK
ncbi:VOC family protein [Enterobacteriaceae bacterium LUAb1]